MNNPKYNKEFSFFPFLMIAVVASVIALTAYGLQKSYNKVQSQDDTRIMQKNKEEADAMKSRQESIKQQTDTAYREAERLKPSFDTRKQQEQIQRSIQPELDKMQKENIKMRERALR